MEADELGALVKKLSSFNLRCSGSSSLTLASSMSLLMAAIRASIGDRDDTEMKTEHKTGQDEMDKNNSEVCVYVH